MTKQNGNNHRNKINHSFSTTGQVQVQTKTPSKKEMEKIQYGTKKHTF